MRSRHWVFLACLLAAACGDDDGGDGNGSNGGGGSTTVDTGLMTSAKLSSLDDEDAQRACMSTAHTFNTVLSDAKWEEIGCVLVGIEYVVQKHGETDASHVSECQSIAKKCVNGDPIDGETVKVETKIADESSCEDASASETFGDCEATVADYERCASKLASELRKRFSGISCDGVKDIEQFQEDLGAEFDLGNAEECQAFRTKCPNLDLGGETNTDIDTGDEG